MDEAFCDMMFGDPTPLSIEACCGDVRRDGDLTHLPVEVWENVISCIINYIISLPAKKAFAELISIRLVCPMFNVIAARELRKRFSVARLSGIIATQLKSKKLESVVDRVLEPWDSRRVCIFLMGIETSWGEKNYHMSQIMSKVPWYTTPDDLLIFMTQLPKVFTMEWVIHQMFCFPRLTQNRVAELIMDKYKELARVPVYRNRQQVEALVDALFRIGHPTISDPYKVLNLIESPPSFYFAYALCNHAMPVRRICFRLPKFPVEDIVDIMKKLLSRLKSSSMIALNRVFPHLLRGRLGHTTIHLIWSLTKEIITESETVCCNLKRALLASTCVWDDPPDMQRLLFSSTESAIADVKIALSTGDLFYGELMRQKTLSPICDLLSPLIQLLRIASNGAARNHSRQDLLSIYRATVGCSGVCVSCEQHFSV